MAVILAFIYGVAGFWFLHQKDFGINFNLGANFAVVLGDPVGLEEEIEGKIRQFMVFCQEHDWELVFHQTLPDFLPLYERLGFRKLKIGDEAIVDLTQFTLPVAHVS